MDFRNVSLLLRDLLKKIRLVFTPGSTSKFIKPNWIAALDLITGRHLPSSFLFLLIWLANHSSPRRLRILYKLRNQMLIPEIKNSTSSNNSVWAISIVRNEEDIIETAIRNLYNQGCEGVIIADHKSTDSTPQIIKRLQLELPNLYLGSYVGAGYFQSFVVTKLASIARQAGAKWVLPFDADEIWVAEGSSLSQILQFTAAEVVIADLHNCFPIGDVNILEKFQVDSKPATTKCVLRVHKGMMVQQGNNVDFTKWKNKEKNLKVFHFPWRSKTQLINKIRLGAQADTDAGLSSAKHWHWAAKQSLETIDELWTRITNGVPVPELTWTRSDGSSRLLEMEWDEKLGPAIKS